MMFTTAQLSVELGVDQRTVERWAKKIGVTKYGPVYVLTQKEARSIQKLVHKGPGRPKVTA